MDSKFSEGYKRNMGELIKRTCKKTEGKAND